MSGFRLSTAAPAAILATTFLAIAAPAGAGDDGAQAPDQRHSSSFMAGDEVSTSGDISGGSVLAGGRIESAASVHGNAVFVGGQVKVTGETQKNLYAAGGEIEVDGRVGRDARLAGGRVTLGDGAEVLGDLALAGGDVVLRGRVAGDARLAGGHVTIDGSVGGNVDVRASQLVVGPNARIDGRLRYRTQASPKIDPAAKITGGVQALPMRWTRGWFEGGRGPAGSGWFGLLVIGIIMILASPALGARLLGHLSTRTGATLGFGILCLLATPAALVLCAITIVGLPLAVVLLLAYLLALLVGYVSGLLAIGQWGLTRISPARAGGAGWQILALVATLIVVGILRRLPLIGGLVGFAVLVAGVGVLLIELSRVAHGSATEKRA